MKNKKVAAVLAFFLGIWGVHRFYLGQRFLGVLYFLLFLFGIATMVEGERVPIVALPAILGFIDFVLFLAMPQEDFDERYNKKRLQHQQRSGRSTYRRDYRQTERTHGQSLQHEPTHREYKKWGVEKFRDYDFEGAIEDFERALQFKEDDSATHFNLACCYSILEDAPKSFFHLDKAVSFGFNQLDKIHTHDALSFLRTQPNFDDFVRNDYRHIQQLPLPQQDLLDTKPQKAPQTSNDLLDQIKRLSDLRDKGILTEEEFSLQKRRILNN